MSESASYPISLLLNRLIHDSGLRRAGLVRSLGYRNIPRGLRRLGLWLSNGEGSHRIIGQMAAAYPNVATELALALRATPAIKKIERDNEWLERCKAEKDAFTPFLHCDGERSVPHPITTFGLTGGHARWTTIEIPQNVLDLPLPDQLSALPPLMADFAVRFGSQVPFFGKLRGFRFVRLTDYFVFDRNGVFVGQVPEPFRPGKVEVWLT